MESGLISRQIFARRALTADGWRCDVLVEIGADGAISAVTPDFGARPAGADEVGVLLPAISNHHSHSFQRILAGAIEKPEAAEGDDDFWTWRKAMYEAVPQLTPEAVEAIAALVQMEMLEAGYAASAEFHYIHNDVSGALYDDKALLSRRVMAAAKTSGVGLTHLPVLYMQGGVDGRPLQGGQLRFGLNEEAFADVFAGAEAELASCPDDFRIGVAPHSLRAVPQQGLKFVTALAGERPIHIHIAEQTGEVEETLAVYGARPIDWLMSNFDVSAQWCLVHATHMSPEEVSALAASGAVAGLCPLTEGNLGDGIFEGVAYLRAGGRFGVGSDSNFRISVSEELRQLEYSQRLRDRQRMVLALDGKSVGRTLYEGAAHGGAQALGRNAGAIAAGKLADLVALDTDNAYLSGVEGDRILDTWIFASDDRLVRDVWSAGRHVVASGRHVAREEITSAYRNAVNKIRMSL